MASVSTLRLVGREPELELLDRFVTRGTSRALVLFGAPGIGKTALWEHGTALARVHGLAVLTARASDAEAQLSFGGLIDLLDGVDLAALGSLPAPQRRALEVSLLRAEPRNGAPEAGAIALGLLNALRALAAPAPVLVAIDDAQWLDPSSRDALAYAARRLVASPVRFLLSRRHEEAAAIERALGDVERVEVGGLSLGAVRMLLSERLGLSLPRFVLRRVVDTTLGNPLHALEVGRQLRERGVPGVADEMPVPGEVAELLDARIAHLSSAAGQALLAASLAGELTVAELAGLVETKALDEAIAAGLVHVEGERARPSHPLFAAAAVARSSARERRELHRRLAEVAAPGVRARHLALATAAPDEDVAAAVARAATAAAARGARIDAVELAEQALRLTPPGTPEHDERLVALASQLATAGELQRVTDLLGPQVESIGSGSMRARAWLVLAEGAHITNVSDYRRHLERALAEAQADPALRAEVVAKSSSAVIAVERIADAERKALEVLPDAERFGPGVERSVLYALAWARALAGRPVDDLCARFAAVSESPGWLAESPERVAAQRLVWRGETAQARAVLERLLDLTDERGEATSRAWFQLHLCELALRVGDVAGAGAMLDEWAGTADSELFATLPYQRCRALLAAVQGAPADAARWASDTIERVEAIGTHWDWLEALRARGTAALLDRDPARAAADLTAVWEHAEREGVDEPGVFPVAPELVETLVELGELDRVEEVVARLQRLSEEHRHPWGLATAERCRAVMVLATRYDAEAAAVAERAAARYAELGLPFDQARTLLAAGRAHRRHRKWAAARAFLDGAAGTFAALGAAGWAEAARSELARVGARSPRAKGALTPAEQRVAELAAAGLANKEIATTLFVSVHTVEEHLSRVYAKLGIRSRSQLASRL